MRGASLAAYVPPRPIGLPPPVCVSFIRGDTAPLEMSDETPAQPSGTTPAATGADAGEPKSDGSSQEILDTVAPTRDAASQSSPESQDSATPAGDGPSDAAGDAPPRKRRRRRRRKKSAEHVDGQPSAAPSSDSDASPSDQTGSPQPAAADTVASMASLAGGLLSHLDDREIPCRLDNCDRTWTWTAQQQIENFGQPPPRRVCSKHASRVESVTETVVPCANPGCDKTWTWSRGARVEQPPRRACDDCQREEKTLVDRDVPCKVGGCRRTWLWTEDGQLKHRAWLRRNAGEPESAERGTGKGRRRGRRRKKQVGSIHTPPPRMCEPCRAKLLLLSDREGPCKVHGCTRMAGVDRDTQLRAWALLHTEDLQAEVPSAPRRMCEVCREFCKNHSDRKIVCGRPGCDKTWTFKTGAQLQAFLAGRLEDPVRLCETCSAGDFVALERPTGAPAGAEVMPCVVLACEGVWYWLPGTRLSPASQGETPLERMCAEHRAPPKAAEDAAAEDTAVEDAAVEDAAVEATSGEAPEDSEPAAL